MGGDRTTCFWSTFDLYSSAMALNMDWILHQIMIDKKTVVNIFLGLFFFISLNVICNANDTQ